MLPDGYTIRPLAAEDASALAAAYRRNRDHLAPFDPVRPESYYTDEGHAREVAKQLEGAAEDRQYTWVLWADDGADPIVVGRIMLSNVIRGVMQSANVGYWVDHRHTGRGLATSMVEHVVDRSTTDLGLHRLEAGTIRDNAASQAVLERAGFTAYGVAEQLLFIAGEWQDHVLFQRILHDCPAGNPRR